MLLPYRRLGLGAGRGLAAARRLPVRVQAGEAGEAQREELIVDPDLAAVLAVDVVAMVQVERPIALAAEAVRQKGRIVLIGVVGLDIPRKPMYLKEAEFVVSCSYGPGRYEADYEQRGHDYPPGLVRWTEQRNIQAVLDLMGGGGIDIEPLITHRFPIGDATKAYDMIESGSEPFLGVVLNYPPVESRELKRTIELRSDAVKSDRVGIGVLGAGNFARMTMLPALQKSGAS